MADAGGWSHAYQEVQVVPDSLYKVTGEFFPEKTGVCDGGAMVKWCSPSVVICPGGYDALFYKTGGCDVGVSPVGNGSWVPFSASFTPTVATVTVYIPQESTRYSSWVKNFKLTSLATQECTSSSFMKDDSSRFPSAFLRAELLCNLTLGKAPTITNVCIPAPEKISFGFVLNHNDHAEAFLQMVAKINDRGPFRGPSCKTMDASPRFSFRLQQPSLPEENDAPFMRRSCVCACKASLVEP